VDVAAADRRAFAIAPRNHESHPEHCAARPASDEFEGSTSEHQGLRFVDALRNLLDDADRTDDDDDSFSRGRAADRR